MPEYRFEEIAINSTEKKKPVEADKDTYLGLEHLDSGSLRVIRWGAEVAPIGDKLVMHKGDVLFGRRRAYQKKVAIAPFDGIFSAHGMVLRPRTEVISERLFPFFVASDYFLDAATKISVGSLSPTINWRDLKNLSFNIPPLAEQDALADGFWALEETKEAYFRLMAATDAIVKSQFIEMFGGNKYPRKTLQELSDVTSGLTKNSKRASFPKKMKYLRVANVFYNKLDLSDVQEIGVEEKEIEKAMLQKNDLLFVEGNGSPDQIGRVALWDGSIEPVLHQNHLIKARFDRTSILAEYAMHFFMSEEGRKQIILSAATTSGLYTLSAGKISSFLLPVPPLAQQLLFVKLAQQTDKSKFATALCQNQALTAPCEQNYDIMSPSRRCF